MELSINLTVEEINALLKMLGEMPTNAGVFPLMVKLQNQAQLQLKEKEVDQTAVAD